MAKRFPGFTYAEHMELGAHLKALHDRIWSLFFDLQKIYPKSSRPMRAMRRLAAPPFGPFSGVKDHLDRAFRSGHPEAGVDATPYYGWGADSDQESNIIPLSAFGCPQQRKPQWLSADQHRDIARRLWAIQNGLQDAARRIWKAYGVSSPQGRAIERIAGGNRLTNHVRFALEDAACKEHDSLDGMAWYWGSNAV